MIKEYLDIKDEVLNAMEEGRPVVALESTIISHGMPYPQNVETAVNVENIVRDNGAVPATIVIINGRLKVGLSREEIEHLGRSANVVKTSRRDIPFIVSKAMTGATTVASTMIIASLALKAKWDMGLRGGVVVANPIPKEYEMDYDTINKAIEEALVQMEKKGVKGKESTPFLLAKVKELTGGSSLESNIQLVYNNALLAAQIAHEFAMLGKCR